MRNDILEKKEYIIKMISENRSKAEICRYLQCKPITLESYLIKMDIKYKGNIGGKGWKISNNRKTAMFYIENGILLGSHKLKIKLIEDGIKKHECEICKLQKWIGKKIPIELHHIDGDRFNNSLNNLQILCPNCHAITENYSGRNKK